MSFYLILVEFVTVLLDLHTYRGLTRKYRLTEL